MKDDTQGSGRLSSWLGIIVGIAILAVLVFSVPFAGFKDAVRRMPPLTVLGAVALSALAALLVEPEKLRRILLFLDRKLTFRETIDLCYPTTAVGVLAPSQSAELLKVRLLNVLHDMSFARGLGVVALDKTMNLYAEGLLLLAGALVSYTTLSDWLSIVFTGLAAVGGLYLFYVMLPSALSNRWATTRSFVREITYPFLRTGFAQKVFVLAYSVGYRFFDVLVLWWLLCGADVEVPFGQIIFWAALSVLASKLPITPAGLGIRETVLVVGLVPYAPTADLVVVSLLFSLTKWVMPALFALAFYQSFRKAMEQVRSDLTYGGTSAYRWMLRRLKREDSGDGASSTQAEEE